MYPESNEGVEEMRQKQAETMKKIEAKSKERYILRKKQEREKREQPKDWFEQAQTSVLPKSMVDERRERIAKFM